MAVGAVPEWSGDASGRIVAAGNTLMTCRTSVACLSVQQRVLRGSNNQWRLVALPSSSATLTLPAGGSVLFAGLYWSGQTPLDASTESNAILTGPGGMRSDISAAYVDHTPDGAFYQGFADVTTLVRAGGPGRWQVGGVANPPHAGQLDPRQYAGWSLVAAVTDPAVTDQRHLAVYDGLVTGAARGANPITVLPAAEAGLAGAGPRVSVVGWEGDGCVPDTLLAGPGGNRIADPNTPLGRCRDHNGKDLLNGSANGADYPYGLGLVPVTGTQTFGVDVHSDLAVRVKAGDALSITAPASNDFRLIGVVALDTAAAQAGTV
ncbi:MAG: hypothetical protein ACR2JQ_05920 [Mycobacteriales bacterium]